jgi:hypothetical protein
MKDKGMRKADWGFLPFAESAKSADADWGIRNVDYEERNEKM